MANRVFRDTTDSEKVNELSKAAEVFFYRLMMRSDDHGIHPAHPQLLNSSLFPLKPSVLDDIITWMGECLENELIIKYSAKGKEYVQILNFGQRLRNMRTKYPHPESADKCPRVDVNSPPESESESESESERETKGAEAIMIFKVIDCLNFVSSASFKPKSQTSITHITARLREKFTFEDFEKVIIYKTAQWSNDQQWSQYLRPQTLFGTKFESYLQAALKETNQVIISKSDEIKNSILKKLNDELTGNAKN